MRKKKDMTLIEWAKQPCMVDLREVAAAMAKQNEMLISMREVFGYECIQESVDEKCG